MARQKPITVGKRTSYMTGSRPVSAKPSEASKVRAAKKTTSDRGRAGRQGVSKAKVTNSGGGTPGSAKVTTGKGGKPSGNFKAPNIPKPAPKPSAKPAAKPSGGLRGGLRSAAGLALLSGIASKTTDTLTRAANPKEWERVSQELKDRGYGSKPSPKPAKPAKPEGSVNRRGRGVAATPKPAAKPANVADYKDAQGNTYDGNSGRLKTAAKAKPSATSKPPAAPSKAPAAPSGPTRSKPAPKGPSSTSKTSSSRNVGPVANGDDYARTKDPKKYNPLMQKTFGYQTGDAPDQRAKRANYAGTDTGVSPKSTGSKDYADKKTTNKTSTAFASGVELSPNKKKLKAKR